jgi:hypothetical protein
MLIHDSKSLGDIPDYVMQQVNLSEDPNSKFKRVTTELSCGRRRTVITENGQPSVMVINKVDITGHQIKETLMIAYTNTAGITKQIPKKPKYFKKNLKAYNETFTALRYRPLHLP